MKHPYEIHQEIERENEREEFKQIIDRPILTSEEIWHLYPDNFYKWRAKHDLPRILKYFSEKLNGFEDWKKESKLSNENLIGFGISNCINPNPSNDKRKFIVESTYEGHKRRFVSYQNINNRFYKMGPNPVEHISISSFIGYIDWCNSKKVRLMDDWPDNRILSHYSSSHPNGYPQLNKVSILKDLELLKIGGIEVKKDGYGMIKPKYFEFVNADYLSLSGRISTQGLQLVFENSFIDHFTCENLDLSLVEFRYSSLRDFYSNDSNIQQWTFFTTGVSGKAYNSDFKMISIEGGAFDLDLSDCTFFEVEARAISKKDTSMENTYRSFKKIYASQGDDQKAIEYFLLEKEVIREKVRKNIFQYQPWGRFTETSKEKFINRFRHIVSHAVSYIQLWINNFYWGYGRKPFRVVANSLGIIILFSILYYLLQVDIKLPEDQKGMSFFDSLYFSAVTFTTLGYGDFVPTGFLRMATAIEAFMGGLSFGFLVAGFSNFKY
jgi:hypothetical protein